jgi:hypothetical protein
MIASMLVALLLPQQPQPQAEWLAHGGDARHPQAVVVTSDIELTAADAFRSAMEHARSSVDDRLRERGAALARAAAPVWMPSFLRERVVDEWLAGHDARTLVEVLDRCTEVREYSYGESYRTALLVQPAPQVVEKARAWFRWRTPDLAEEFLLRCGGVGALWGLLGLACLWLDRLTRGYMTWRLRLLGTGLGAVGTTIAFLL